MNLIVHGIVLNALETDIEIAGNQICGREIESDYIGVVIMVEVGSIHLQ